MKSLFVLITLAIAATASAMSLADYDKSLNYMVSWPTVVMSNLSVPVKNVCVDGNVLKTVNAVKYCSQPAVVEVCTKIGSHGSEECRSVAAGETPVQAPGVRLVWGCAAYTSADFSTTISYQASVCTKWVQVQSGKNMVWQCSEFGTETKDYPLSYTVSVYQNSTGHGGGRTEIASLPFSIPQCN